ncbi:HNH endonuclease [Neorhizobium sp. P12A]|uniref:HNH endonuclease n=1 Tax=Neorhizobium sp. P12A TaxID=2268027 RepID=UPI00165D512B|nr:HNH endonuclease [Neorhizobium sp. P12A]
MSDILNWIERAMVRTEIDRSSGCWLYNYDISHNGYGRLDVDGKRVRIHRLSYGAFKGEIPEGVLVCHRCDVRNCWNPNHLFLGTPQDNFDDMVSKGRNILYTPGSPISPKLTEPQVLEILSRIASGEDNKSLAEEFGVAGSSISKIRKGKTWKKLTVPSSGQVMSAEACPPPHVSAPSI